MCDHKEILKDISQKIYELERYNTDIFNYVKCVKDCSTCKNNVEFPPPHTCDICTSLDQKEEYEMWEAKE